MKYGFSSDLDDISCTSELPFDSNVFSQDPVMGFDLPAKKGKSSNNNNKNDRMDQPDAKNLEYRKSQNIYGCYRSLFNRYKEKREIYAYAASFYSNLELFAFMLPNILIQIVNVVLPIILMDDAQGPSPGSTNHKNLTIAENNPQKMDLTNNTNPNSYDQLVRKIISCLAAVSAVWLGLAGKLQIGKKSEKFKTISDAYASLCSKAYYKHKESLIEGYSQDFRKKCSELLSFLAECEEQEKLARSGAAFMPFWIINKVRKIRVKNCERKGFDRLASPAVRNFDLEGGDQFDGRSSGSGSGPGSKTNHKASKNIDIIENNNDNNNSNPELNPLMVSPTEFIQNEHDQSSPQANRSVTTQQTDVFTDIEQENLNFDL